jgi:hypothetical protein
MGIGSEVYQAVKMERIGLNIGSALSRSRSKELWNANMVGLQFGVKVYKRFYFEIAASASSYNIFTATARYQFLDRESPLRFAVGLGVGMATKKLVWVADQTAGLGIYSYYIVPQASLILPIGDVHIRADFQIFASPFSFKQFIFTFQPGIQFSF